MQSSGLARHRGRHTVSECDVLTAVGFRKHFDNHPPQIVVFVLNWCAVNAGQARTLFMFLRTCKLSCERARTRARAQSPAVVQL